MKYQRPKRLPTLAPLLRAIGVVSAVVIVVSGVTFALLQSQQVKATGNTIQTATANLQISSDGTTFGSSITGFSFSNIIPNSAASPAAGYSVYLKNTGTAALAIKLAVSSVPQNLANMDLSKVHILVSSSTGGSPLIFDLQSLISSASTGGSSLSFPSALNIAANAVGQYKLQVMMDTDAISGSSGTLSNIDLAFTGVAQ